MRKMYIGFLCAALVVAWGSCGKKKLNKGLYEEASDGGLVLYKNKDSIMGAAGGSPHGKFKLKFNTIASGQFGADGKFPAGATFLNGSLIVKEVYSGNELTLYAVMKKDPESKFASGGWLWAEYNPGGETEFSVAKKGDGCVSCHSGSPNRDLTRSFDLH